MNHFRKYMLLILFHVIHGNPAMCQDANEMLGAVVKKFSVVKEYKAKMVIKTRIPFINMLPVSAEIYFRQPDHVRIRSKGIAVLPRQGFDQMFTFLSDSTNYTAVFMGKTTVSGKQADLVSVIPANPSSEIILGKFWVDSPDSLILVSEITTRSNGTVHAEYSYGNYQKFALPDYMQFTIDTKKFKIPKVIAADINNYNPASEDSGNKVSKGRIFISFSNYEINKGIPDEVFKKK